MNEQEIEQKIEKYIVSLVDGTNFKEIDVVGMTNFIFENRKLDFFNKKMEELTPKYRLSAEMKETPGKLEPKSFGLK